MTSRAEKESAPKGSEKDKDDVLATLHNPARDANSGRVWPIFLVIIAVSIGWIIKDPELRRGLGQITGFHAIEPIVEQIVDREHLVTVHGSWTSGCTQRVVMAAYEKELEVEMKPVDMANKQHKSAEYLNKRHPFGQIPVLEVNEDLFVHESRAIAHYLDRRWPKRGTSFALYNSTLAFVQYDQALSFEAFDFDPFAHAIYKEAVMKPKRGKGTDEAALQAALAAFEDKMDGYERVLAERTYLGGNLTLADLYHLPLGTKLIEAGHGSALTDGKKRPHVAKWWNSLYERPSWQAVLKDIADWQEEQRRLKEEREKEAASSTSSQVSSASSALSTASSSISSSMKAEESAGKKHHGIFH